MIKCFMCFIGIIQFKILRARGITDLTDLVVAEDEVESLKSEDGVNLSSVSNGSSIPHKADIVNDYEKKNQNSNTIKSEIKENKEDKIPIRISKHMFKISCEDNEKVKFKFGQKKLPHSGGYLYITKYNDLYFEKPGWFLNSSYKLGKLVVEGDDIYFVPEYDTNIRKKFDITNELQKPSTSSNRDPLTSGEVAFGVFLGIMIVVVLIYCVYKDLKESEKNKKQEEINVISPAQ